MLANPKITNANIVWAVILRLVQLQPLGLGDAAKTIFVMRKEYQC